jgi:hypothetical protein
METAFKLFFAFGVFLFGLLSVGVFLIIVRIVLTFQPVVHFMGFAITLLN